MKDKGNIDILCNLLCVITHWVLESHDGDIVQWIFNKNNNNLKPVHVPFLFDYSIPHIALKMFLCVEKWDNTGEDLCMSCFQPLNSLGHIDGILEGDEESF